MLKKLKIENFRCFKSFELNHLGRVNLLVGENNSGKTSILEALKIFFSDDIFKSLKQIMVSHGEYSQNTDKFDISYLFNQHELRFDRQIVFFGAFKDDNHAQVKLSIIEIRNKEKFKYFLKWIRQEKRTSEEISMLEAELTQKGIDFQKIYDGYSISPQGKLYEEHDTVEPNSLMLDIETKNIVLENKFVNSFSLTPQESLELFNQIVLTPEENLVYQALQIIEPNIERIAPIGNEIKNNNSRSGFFVRLSDTQKRIPIGSMGDGIWRMLGLSLALVSAKDGVLLVDEIDTGLHYTALENMWKLIWETSKKLNVQVFATTHNSDCWKALEALTNREDVGEEDISIQRIEKDAPRSVAYNKEEIATAVEREIEVR
ncbi:MAG: AAA family ATPase [Waterburya sp.]